MEISVDQVEARIQEKFREFAEGKCVDTLKEVCPVGKTKKLRESIHPERLSDDLYFVGTDLPYAKYVENGRGQVHPVEAQAIWWKELPHPIPYAKSAPARHFVEKAVAQLK